MINYSIERNGLRVVYSGINFNPTFGDRVRISYVGSEASIDLNAEEAIHLSKILLLVLREFNQ